MRLAGNRPKGLGRVRCSFGTVEPQGALDTAPGFPSGSCTATTLAALRPDPDVQRRVIEAPSNCPTRPLRVPRRASTLRAMPNRASLRLVDGAGRRRACCSRPSNRSVDPVSPALLAVRSPTNVNTRRCVAPWLEASPDRLTPKSGAIAVAQSRSHRHQRNDSAQKAANAGDGLVLLVTHARRCRGASS